MAICFCSRADGDCKKCRGLIFEEKKAEVEMARLEKITIVIGDKVLELSSKEAQELKSVLEELFGKTIIKNDYAYSYPYTPYKKTWNEVWCSDTTNTVFESGDKVVDYTITMRSAYDN